MLSFIRTRIEQIIAQIMKILNSLNVYNKSICAPNYILLL